MPYFSIRRCIKILAIHLHYKNADLSGYSLKNKRGIYNQETASNLSRILQNNVNTYMQTFPRDLFNDSYYDKIKKIIDAAGQESHLESSQYYSDISSLITHINKLSRQGKDISQSFQTLSEEINNLDSFVDSLIKDNVELMALFSPEFRQLIGLSLPENGSIITLNANMQALKRRMNLDPQEGMKKLQKVVADTVGFIHEAEILRGALRAYKEGEEKVPQKIDMLFVQSGAIKKNENVKSEELISKLNDAEQTLYSAMSSISTSTPKADLIGYINGLTIGLSLKNAAQNKLEIKNKISWSRSKAITLGGIGKPLGEIMDENVQAFGKCDKTYLAQLIYSFHDQFVSDAATRIRDILDLAADLTLIDSLTGFKIGHSTAGTAQFFIVNNQAFEMTDIINAVIKSLEQNNRTGVFTANTSIASSVVRAGEEKLQQKIEKMEDINEKHAAQIELGELWANSYYVKTKISLTALMSGNNILRSI